MTPEFLERVRRTTAALRTAAREAGAIVSGDGRVSERVAAELLGIETTKLRRLRYSRQLMAFHLGVNGGRVSFRISDLAAFIELSADVDDIDDANLEAAKIDDAAQPEVGATADVVPATVAASEMSAGDSEARPASGDLPEAEPAPAGTSSQEGHKREA